MKLCCHCKIPLTLENAYLKKSGYSIGKFHSVCKGCNIRKSKEWTAKNLEKVKKNRPKYDLKANYGLSLEDFNTRVVKQENKCAICLNPFSSTKNRQVDHCHKTGEVRGLLCRYCNIGLGNFKDSPALLRAAEIYLNKVPAFLGEGFACSL